MAKRIRWGILSTSKFARTKVLPALARCERLEVAALASRDAEKAKQVCKEFSIPTAYDSYEALLADPTIDVIYNPLPNHLHVPWTIRAAQAGKHVLCEKPLGMNAAEVEQLIEVRNRAQVQIGEAFMVATHPQWLAVRDAINTGRIGDLRVIQGFFSYNNIDPANIRNNLDTGGGAIMDIGCYPIFTSRWVLGRDPLRVSSLIERDPQFGTDRISSATLDFGDVRSQFTCSTQLVPYQRMNFYGTKGRIEIEIPFNAPPDRPCRIFTDDGRDVFGTGITAQEFPTVDQYTLEGDAFSAAVQGEREVPVGLEFALGNMRTIDAIFRSASENRWADLLA